MGELKGKSLVDAMIITHIKYNGIIPRKVWKLKSCFHVGPKKAIVATATTITATEKEEQVVAATAQ